MTSRPVTKLRISIVQYLNTAPLVWGFTNGPLHGKYDLSFTVPSQCSEDLRTGRADVAIIPAIEYQRIDDLVILPDMAIASKKQVRSLLIVSKKPVEQVESFALDRSSRSTQALTRILCAEKWKTAPEFFEATPDLAEMLEQADAALLIGDPALRISLGIEKDSHAGAEGQTICPAATLGISSSELLYVYDVVSEWRSLTELPAVLADAPPLPGEEARYAQVMAVLAAAKDNPSLMTAMIAAATEADEKLVTPLFLDAFLGKGRLRHLMEVMPVKVITNDKLALLGAARCALLETAA